MHSDTFAILAQDRFGDMLYPIAILVLSLLGWIGGKIKKARALAAPRPAERAPARPDEDADEEEADDDTRVIDLAELLGIRPTQRPEAPPAPAARAAPVARPAQGVPPPWPPQQTPAPPAVPLPVPVAVEPAPTREVAPLSVLSTSIDLSPVVAPRPAGAPRSRRASRRLGPLTRADLRRAIVLNEILGKPLALRNTSDAAWQ